MSLLRPARVLFLSPPGEPMLSEDAVRWARRLASGWVDARSGCAECNAGLAGNLVWADTVVILATTETFEAPKLPDGTRSTLWRLPAHGDAEQINVRLRERVAGMVGGLRLLGNL